jgi:hypothetical protein
MTLAQLYDQLAPSLHPSARKNVQTAIRVLATTLHCADPQHCLPEHYQQPLPTLTQLIDNHLHSQGKGAITIRNTKNNIRRLFRLAQERHIVSLAPASLTSRYDSKSKPHRPGSESSQHHGFYLLYRQWPADLQEAFTAFQTWATAPVVPGRDASLRKRPGTAQDYRRFFEALLSAKMSI